MPWPTALGIRTLPFAERHDELHVSTTPPTPDPIDAPRQATKALGALGPQAAADEKALSTLAQVSPQSPDPMRVGALAYPSSSP